MTLSHVLFLYFFLLQNRKKIFVILFCFDYHWLPLYWWKMLHKTNSYRFGSTWWWIMTIFHFGRTMSLSKHTGKIKICNSNINPLIYSLLIIVTWLRWRSLQGNSGCHGSGKHPPLGTWVSPQPSHDRRSLWTSCRISKYTLVLT